MAPPDEDRHCWDDVIDETARIVSRRGPAAVPELGSPALLLVDLYKRAFGDRREPLLRAVERFPRSCGEAAWDALGPLQELLGCARHAGVPIVFTTLETRPESRVGGSTHMAPVDEDPAWAASIVDPLAPRDGELVVYKTRASAFFGTTLESSLRKWGVDSLVVAGESTSGCVRASVVDAYSHGFEVLVVEEATFDRVELSHKVNLFDMHQKYATVVRLDEALAALSSS